MGAIAVPILPLPFHMRRNPNGHRDVSCFISFSLLDLFRYFLRFDATDLPTRVFAQRQATTSYMSLLTHEITPRLTRTRRRTKLRQFLFSNGMLIGCSSDIFRS